MTSGSRPSSSQRDPYLALAVRIDAAHPEDVRPAEGTLLKPLLHLLGDIPCLLHGVVHEHVGADVEVGPAGFRHGLADQLPQKREFQGMPLGLQGLSVVQDELEGQRREGRGGWLAHGMFPCGVVKEEDFIARRRASRSFFRDTEYHGPQPR